mgnify:CR=1 FL=1
MVNTSLVIFTSNVAQAIGAGASASPSTLTGGELNVTLTAERAQASGWYKPAAVSVLADGARIWAGGQNGLAWHDGQRWHAGLHRRLRQ